LSRWPGRSVSSDPTIRTDPAEIRPLRREGPRMGMKADRRVVHALPCRDMAQRARKAGVLLAAALAALLAAHVRSGDAASAGVPSEAGHVWLLASAAVSSPQSLAGTRDGRLLFVGRSWSSDGNAAGLLASLAWLVTPVAAGAAATSHHRRRTPASLGFAPSRSPPSIAT
jgi:hypothetical protein